METIIGLLLVLVVAIVCYIQKIKKEKKFPPGTGEVKCVTSDISRDDVVYQYNKVQVFYEHTKFLSIVKRQYYDNVYYELWYEYW